MKLKSFFTLGFAAAFALGLASCGKKSDGPMLRLHVEGAENPDMQVVYNPDGDIMGNQYIKVELDSLGNFDFNPEFPEGVEATEIEIYTQKGVYGAYIEKDASSQVNFVFKGEGKPEVTFAGDNVDLSEFVSTYADAFDMMKYFSMDPEQAKTFPEYYALLDENNAKVVEKLESIKNSKKKDYYAKLTKKMYDWQRARILLDEVYADTTQANPLENADYAEIIANIDPNDAIDGKAKLVPLWLNAQNMNIYNHVATVDDYIAELELIDSVITNPANRRGAFNLAGNSFLSYTKPSAEDAGKYMEAFKKYASEYPEFIEKYQAKADVIMAQVQPGQKLPYMPKLEARDGSTVDMADLLGKVLYIDVWATWCGPCQREIPKFAEANDRFKGNNKIEFISISVDEDRDAWLEQLNREKPSWKQFRLTAEENAQFSKAMNIQGIPRFILVAPDGTLIAPDAERPSSENIDTVLNAAIAK